MNRLIKVVKSWKVGDYLRQLSIVIAGIVITFTASDAITGSKESGETRNALQLVKDELVLNREHVRQIRDRIELEQNACSYILKFKGSFEKASEDSLKMYRNIPFQTRSFIYTRDAIELLKTSSSFQKIEPKTLSLQIIKAYNELETVAVDVRDFYSVKSGYMSQLLNSGKFDVYQYKQVGDYWRELLSFREGWNICNFVVQNFTAVPFGDTEAYLSDVIKNLEEEYQLK